MHGLAVHTTALPKKHWFAHINKHVDIKTEKTIHPAEEQRTKLYFCHPPTLKDLVEFLNVL